MSTLKINQQLKRIEIKEFEIENPVVFKWTTEYAENIRLITNRECENIFKDHKNGWNKFRTIYGKRIVDVSKPIFS